MKKLTFLLLTCLCTAQPLFASPFYNVTDYGAKGDGMALNTKFIQKVIDDCASKGGGTVYFPAGQYLSGTLFLKSNITLYLDAGAELLGSNNLADYPPTIPAIRTHTETYTERSLIYAEKLEHISIIGQGILNGNGNKFPVKIYPLKDRPYLMRIIECSDIRIKDITLKNPAMWTQHYLACENLFIDNIRVDSWDYNRNNDGIDLDGCNRVMITNSYFKTEDDAVTLKSTSPRPDQNITISNCVISSLCNAIKCGTESVGGFENIAISNCTIFNTRYSGIALESVDGGIMRNITINNIAMNNVSCPIYIRLGSRMTPYIEGAPKHGVGTAEDITISNIRVTGAGGFTHDMLSTMYAKAKAHANPLPIGSSILGIPGHPVKNVVIKDISIDYPGTGQKAVNNVPEKETDYPNYDRLGDFPSYAFYCRHADGLRFENIKVTYRSADTRPAIWLDDVQHTTISGLDAQFEKETDALIVAERCKQIVIQNCNYFEPIRALLSLMNGTSDVIIKSNALPKQSAFYVKDATIDKRTVMVKE